MDALSAEKGKPDQPADAVVDRTAPTPAPVPRVRPGKPGVIEFSMTPGESQQIRLGASLVPHRQGEDGILKVCQRLVDHLAARGIHWGNPEIPPGAERGVDCVCRADDGPVMIQVTRAIHDPDYFATLGKHNAVVADTTIQELAQSLWESIDHKAERTPQGNRGTLVLVLDASEFFISNDSQLLGLFAATFAEKVNALGFRAIWLVGSHHLLVTQLA